MPSPSVQARPPPVVSNLETELSGDRCLHFVPDLWTYASADSVLVLCNTQQKVIVAVQVTYEVPSNKEKARKTSLFFDTNHWQKFILPPDEEWTKVILRVGTR